jgi:hypothetical protein
MPAKNPRLTITLEPSTAAQLRRLSELTGNSQSALIAELLTDSGPVFDRLIVVLQAATDAKASMRGALAQEMASSQEKLEQQLGLELEAGLIDARALLDEAERVVRRARKTAASGARATPRRLPGGVATPPSNRGVRSTAPQAGKGAK